MGGFLEQNILFHWYPCLRGKLDFFALHHWCFLSTSLAHLQKEIGWGVSAPLYSLTSLEPFAAINQNGLGTETEGQQ